jgi:A/G-specific adenine glycosylase
MGTPDISRSAPEAARRILSWYRRNGRPLPWRQTRRPYHILVSEVMLQQTQVARVEQKYSEFLRQFPTLSALARAPKRDVVMAWRGLGYNSRAVRLHALAQHLDARNNSRFPDDVGALMQLPGVGRYTAHAMAVFAFGQQVPVVDVNVRRVLSRIFFGMKTAAAVADESTIWAFAGRVLPARRAYDWNQALMDLGATVCTAARPRCTACPVSDACTSRATIVSDQGTLWARQRRPAQRERSHRGTPLRLYRGRVIEALRNAHPRRTIAASQLGRAILPKFTWRDRQVFHRVLRALERDGLVEVRRNRQSVPEKVSLA